MESIGLRLGVTIEIVESWESVTSTSWGAMIRFFDGGSVRLERSVREDLGESVIFEFQGRRFFMTGEN